MSMPPRRPAGAIPRVGFVQKQSQKVGAATGLEQKEESRLASRGVSIGACEIGCEMYCHWVAGVPPSEGQSHQRCTPRCCCCCWASLAGRPAG